MSGKQRIALALASTAILVGLMLVISRGGLIAWLTLLLGAALVTKIWLKPSHRDVPLSIGLGLAATVLWFGTLYYVIATYESGEVVELAIPTEAGIHHARLWTFEFDGTETLYYDAPPAAASSLLASTPISLTREKEEAEQRIPIAKLADELSGDDAAAVLTAMEAKYGDRMAASTLYYVLLGRPRDRLAVIVSFADG